MGRCEYNKAINKNTLECWGIILLVLLISYSIEIIRGLRTIPYFFVFLAILIIPYAIAVYYNFINKGDNLKLKHIFAISYLMLYSFVLLTTKTFVTYVYIIPMLSILIAYCDTKLIFKMFLYTVILNLVTIYLQYLDFEKINFIITIDLKTRITMWEIQIALIILSGLFLSKACLIIKKRDDILDILSDDINKDSLTGIYNKKFLENSIYKMYQEDKYKSLAFIDVDDFKNFNTLYGHTFGDEVLITICKVINENIKEFNNTYLIRVGGDEFIIFSLDFNKNDFEEIMKMIVDKVGNTKIPFGNKLVGIKISVGISCTDKDKCNKFMDLYNLADKRNAKAKKKGKNHVESN